MVVPSNINTKTMTQHIKRATQIKACGNIPKIIKEYIGRVNSKTDQLSIAKMESPKGWTEPGQTPEFDEYTVVLDGMLHAKLKDKEFNIGKGEAFIAVKGEWVQYSSPFDGGAQYIAVCLPAFSSATVHRDAQ